VDNCSETRQIYTIEIFKIVLDHFHETDFIYNFGLKTVKTGAFGLKTVKTGAVPRIFQFPSHLIKKQPKERSARLKSVTKPEMPSAR
jgi:hypothetical protein